MSVIDDGGPAFPVVFEHGDTVSEAPGMSLRDWFAGQVSAATFGAWYSNKEALIEAGEYASRLSIGLNEMAARGAYELADAMLLARAGKMVGSAPLEARPSEWGWQANPGWVVSSELYDGQFLDYCRQHGLDPSCNDGEAPKLLDWGPYFGMPLTVDGEKKLMWVSQKTGLSLTTEQMADRWEVLYDSLPYIARAVDPGYSTPDWRKMMEKRRSAVPCGEEGGAK